MKERLLVCVGMMGLAAAHTPAPAANEQPIYQCTGDGHFTEVKIVGGEWFERQGGEAWKAAGCAGPSDERSAATSPITCDFSDERVTTLAPLVSMSEQSGAAIPLIEKVLIPASRTYSVQYKNLHDAPPISLSCELYQEGEEQPWKSWPVTRKVAAGMPFILVLDRSALRLKQGRWDYDTGRWIIVEGQYHPTSSTWASRGVGFDPVGNPLHACPSGSMCGGIHESGKVLDRPHRPEQGEIIVFGEALAFDDTGSILRSGTKIGIIVFPDF